MERLERAKKDNLGQFLLRAARLYNEICVKKYQRHWPEFSLAHTRLFPHFDMEHGIRPSELARLSGVSKQNLNHLLNGLQQQGYVERRPDPQDGRARLVHVTESGREAMVLGLGVFKELEAELTASLDEERVGKLKTILLDVVEFLEEY